MIDTLVRLSAFVAVYEERSFTLAANRESLTQSGMTQHIQKLETHFGVTLFSRRGNTVVPTPAAELYYAHVVEVLRARQASSDALRQWRGSLQGEVQVGLNPTVSRSVLAVTLIRFLEEHPLVKVQVIDAYGDIILDKVGKGEVDFGVVAGFPRVPGIRAELVATSPEFLLVGRRFDTAMPTGTPVRLKDLGPLKLLLPSQAQLRRKDLDAYFAAHGVQVAATMEMDSASGTRDLVKHSDWVSLHPGISVMADVEADGFRSYPLHAPPLMVGLFCVQPTRKRLSTEAEIFKEMLFRETKKLEHQSLGYLER